MAKFHDMARIAYCPTCHKYIPESEVTLIWRFGSRKQRHIECLNLGVVYRNAVEVEEAQDE